MAMMSVQIPVEDSLWNNAAKSFEERGTNIFDATKGFLKKAAETKQKTTSLENGRNAFFTLREQAAASGMQDMSFEEINRYISLTRKGM
mgnify:CR=1 FL=1